MAAKGLETSRRVSRVVNRNETSLSTVVGDTNDTAVSFAVIFFLFFFRLFFFPARTLLLVVL